MFCLQTVKNGHTSRLSPCVIGLAYVDLTRRILGLADFLDDNRFTNQESSLVALGHDHLGKFIDLVESSVDLDQLENGEYRIPSSYDTTLASLKDQKEWLEQQIHELHKKTATELDLQVDKALKRDKTAQFGHVFRITKKEEPKIRKKLTTQFVVLETRKDGVKFTNTKLKKLGDQYQSVVDDYRSCQK